MKSLIFTLFNTKKGLNLLDEEFEDDLYRKSTIIFCFFGILLFILNFKTQDYEFGFFMSLFELVLSILLSVIVGTIFSSILYKISNLLEGKGLFIEIHTLVSYAFASFIIGILVIKLLQKFGANYNFINVIYFLNYFFLFKILFKGLLKFNKYGVKKAAINLLVPMFFVSILFFFLYNNYLN